MLPGGGERVSAIGIRGPTGCLGPGESVRDVGEKVLLMPGGPMGGRGPGESVRDMGENGLAAPGGPMGGIGGYICIEACEPAVIVRAGTGLRSEESDS